MSLRSFFSVAAVASLTACASVGTRPALVSDRPDFTESAATIDRRHVQVEAGHTIAREGALHATSTGEVLVRAGLGKRLELRVAGNSWLREVEAGQVNAGLQDGSLGMKVKLLEGADGPSWRPALSVIAASSVPTGTNIFRSSRLQPEVKVIGAWTLSERTSFSSNVNASRPFNGVRSFTEYSASGSFGLSLADRVGSYLEAFAFAPQDGSGVVSKYVNGGFTFLFSPDVQLDMRAGIGPTGSPAHSHFYGVGLVVRR